MNTPVWTYAWGSCLVLLAAAFIAAGFWQGSGWLSLTPPASVTVPNPAPDVIAGAELPLYQAAFTAWAVLLLLIPAYGTVWRRHKPLEAQVWLAFWTVSWVAYAVHLYVSMFWFFGGDFAAMTTSTRVSAFWPGLVIALWWPLDAALALRGVPDRGWVWGQRVVIHVLVLVLFVGGSAVKGELNTVKLIGALLLVVALLAMVRWFIYGRGQVRP
ncbi:hypothetical protein [Algirhabdus cladophorae]|uniref:hypothetical protein n=1 Tax=Algirhabdus cladophorae TaxID=3377108 RepID=UPI003B84885B